MQKYAQLTEHKRYQIYILKKAEHTQAYIAKMVGVSASTISRELKRNLPSQMQDGLVHARDQDSDAFLKSDV
jgi:IS30 family transposase